MQEINTNDLSVSIAAFLLELYSQGQIGDEVSFYIATPPQQQEFVSETTSKVSIILARKLGSSVPVYGLSTINSLQHMDESYKNCQFFNHNSHEVLSLFEQELCSRGKVFVYAPSSSWSGKWFKILTPFYPFSKKSKHSKPLLKVL